MPCRDKTLAWQWHGDEAAIGTNTSPSGVSSHSPVWALAERKTNVLIRGLFQCHSSQGRRMRWGCLQGKRRVEDDERKMDVSAVGRASNGDLMRQRASLLMRPHYSCWKNGSLLVKITYYDKSKQQRHCYVCKGEGVWISSQSCERLEWLIINTLFNVIYFL